MPSAPQTEPSERCARPTSCRAAALGRPPSAALSSPWVAVLPRVVALEDLQGGLGALVEELNMPLVPRQARWPLLAGNVLGATPELYAHAIGEVPAFDSRCIASDVSRTALETLDRFPDARFALSRVLRGIAGWQAVQILPGEDERLGYSSGMSFVGAFLLLTLKDEYLTFLTFANFLAKSSFFSPGSLQRRLDSLERRMASAVPGLLTALDARSVHLAMFAAAPLATGFCLQRRRSAANDEDEAEDEERGMPMAVVREVWDGLLAAPSEEACNAILEERIIAILAGLVPELHSFWARRHPSEFEGTIQRLQCCFYGCL